MKRSQKKVSICSPRVFMFLGNCFFPLFILAQCLPTQSFNSPGSYAYQIPTGNENYKITITARGADGGNYTDTPGRGGGGATIVASFNVNGNDELAIYVGDGGKPGTRFRAGGGGGGSAVVLNGEALLIVGAAGGGSGGNQDTPSGGGGGRADRNSGPGGGNSLSGYAASGGGFLDAGDDGGTGGSEGGGAGSLGSLGQGGAGTLGAGAGGLGFGGGGGAAGQFGGGGGGYRGGNGASLSNFAGLGGNSYVNSIYLDQLISSTGGVTGGGVSADGFVQITCAAILPVELTEFNGFPLNDDVKLIWSTTSELNNKGFEIEYSHEGIIWEQIGYVAGRGTTAETQSYEFIHNTPIVGMNYYRLKQIDFDGVFEFSKVISVNMTAEKQFALFPNPTSGELLLSGLEVEKTTLEIVDNLGKTIRKVALSDQQIDISDLPNGMYFLILRTIGETLVKRIVKDN